MSNIAHLSEPELVLFWIKPELHLSGSVKHLLQDFVMFLYSIATNNDVIHNYCTWISSKYLFHGSLEDFRDSVNAKRHPQELDSAKGGCEGSVNG